MANITINFKKNAIEITKSFEKKASVYDSAEYRDLCNAKKEFPEFRLVVKANKNANTFKGMDYNFMSDYISKHDDPEQHMAEFEKLRGNNLSYGEIKQWFVEAYPVFENCKTRAQWILSA